MATAETEIVDQVSAPPKRISLDEYKKMAEDGVLGPDDRTELLDGLLVKKMTKGLRHVAITHRLFRTLLVGLPGAWHARKEDPIELPGGPEQNAPSVPEPDLVVLKGGDGAFDSRYPTPDDIALAVEVATDGRMLSRDRAGLARYAWNRIPCVWIVNLAAGVIEVYTNPTGAETEPVYQSHEVKRPDETIKVPLGGDHDMTLDVGQLLA